MAALRGARQRLRDGALERITPLVGAIGKRVAKVEAAIAKAAAAVDPADEVSALQDAAKALLGDDVTLVPELSFAPAQSADLADAIASSGHLLAYAQQTAPF